MIARYTLPEMGSLWTDRSRFEHWLEVELAVLKVLSQKKTIPANIPSKIKSKAKIKPERIFELEKTLKHDVIAFTTSIAEQVGDAGRFFHYGLTSSDVVDTAFSIVLKKALLQIEERLDALLVALKKQALASKNIPCIGRTHGIHAEPTSFGLRFLGWYTEFFRQKQRLNQAIETIGYGKLSGAVGAYGKLSPEIEKKALELLGLKAELVSTQVLPRDRHLEVFQTLSSIACSVERVAVELRHLQRSEVHEVEESFGSGQKGSSAMPHKKNPISAENLTGCARLLRSYAQAASENVALWHERDISHSSVERVIAPDATILLDYMLHRLTGVIAKLKVMKPNIQKNLNLTGGIYFSGRVLLEMVQRGMSREDAYAITQKAAHAAWDKKTLFINELWKEKSIRELFTQRDLKQIMNVKIYLEHVDTVYDRVLKHVGKN